MGQKVTFFIDGFNIYHSIKDIQRDRKKNCRWLDLYSLCKSYLIGFGKSSKLERVFYFSALPQHLVNTHKKDRIVRHQAYIECLKSTSVEIILGRFKKKQVYCNRCKCNLSKYEEKETDVSISIQILDEFMKERCDMAVVVSGDTDLAPVARKCQELFPNKKFIFAFPYGRTTKTLKELCKGSFSIKPKKYIDHQFEDSVLVNGKKIFQPKNWR